MATKYIPFYNVSNSVGSGGFNERTDVLLIQFFLSEIAKRPPHPIPPPSDPLPVNGDNSNPQLLVEWILWFQNSVRRAGKSIAVDGRVDPASTFFDWQYVNSTRGFFLDTGTMVNINFTYRRRFKEAHNALERASNFPVQLAAMFTD